VKPRLLLAILALGLGCRQVEKKVDPDCLKSEDQRPQRCRQDWCGGPCSDAEAFQWITGYDKCMSEWTDEEVLKNDFVKKEGTARNHCYKWFLEHHQGITDAQIQRYRTLNGPPHSK
jgi:hypothetical protein